MCACYPLLRVKRLSTIFKMAASATSSASRVELLSNDNYDTWIIQMEAWLRRSGLWKYVDGTIAKPERSSSAAPPEALLQWTEKDDQARTELILSIQPRLLKDIKHCTSAREIWNKLRSIYASTGPAKRASLLKQLTQRKMGEGSDVRDHLNDFFETADKLASMEEVISDNLLTVMLLNSLPSSYQGFRTAIETRDILPSPEKLKVKILEHNESTREEIGNDVIVMAARQNKGGTRPREKRVLKCFKCGAKGHKANECPNKSVNKSREKTKCSANKVDGAFAVSHTVLNSGCVYEAKTTTESKPWILDSGCTSHLCSDDVLFEKIDKAAKVKLNLASDATTEVKGRGDVRVSVGCDDGHKLFEFRNTLYVPDLRTNLMSVAKITDKDCEVIFKKDRGTVVNSQGEVIMIADRKGDLYYVRESVECAEVTASKLMDDKLRLWHERLGHLNSKDLVKLVNDKVLPKIDVSNADQLSRCEVCLKGKMTALPFKSKHKR